MAQQRAAGPVRASGRTVRPAEVGVGAMPPAHKLSRPGRKTGGCSRRRAAAGEKTHRGRATTSRRRGGSARGGGTTQATVTGGELAAG